MLDAHDEEPAAGGLLRRGFFAGSSLAVAPRLLGCVLEHATGEGLVAVALTEVEAYNGSADPARTPTGAAPAGTRSCSASPGTRTCTSPTACISA
jgi:3-methyladenine DNA glycosylase